MPGERSKSGGVGLERLCGAAPGDWVRSIDLSDGIELFEARFCGAPYRKHRHDTYAISLTISGVQGFDYRGAGELSGPGQVVVLHPDELHDGYAGSDAGFGYRQVYVEPALISDAVRAVRGRASALPFVRTPVVTSQKLASAVAAAFACGHVSLAIDGLVVQLAEGLLEADPSCVQVPIPRHLDVATLSRARAFLDAEKTRVVRSTELEAVTGLTRYELARQFRLLYGTSPYRYLLMRRLHDAREQVAQGRPLSAVAADAGFADQAHFARMFTATFGFTPARYRALRRDAGEVL
jgi:AraC-like DNA-binding protein